VRISQGTSRVAQDAFTSSRIRSLSAEIRREKHLSTALHIHAGYQLFSPSVRHIRGLRGFQKGQRRRAAIQIIPQMTMRNHCWLTFGENRPPDLLYYLAAIKSVGVRRIRFGSRSAWKKKRTRRLERGTAECSQWVWMLLKRDRWPGLPRTSWEAWSGRKECRVRNFLCHGEMTDQEPRHKVGRKCSIKQRSNKKQKLDS
jgi:hypothetical protein